MVGGGDGNSAQPEKIHRLKKRKGAAGFERELYAGVV
jgi:hypothetical protein